MGYYNDLREYIVALKKSGNLVTIKRQIDKDTELMPLVRWEFRGLPEKARKAFLFKKVTDVKGKKYNGMALVGSHAASRAIYALAMQCQPTDIMKKWEEAQSNSVKPKMVKAGPVHEEVHKGANLMEHGGLGEFCIPISTPGFDNAPYCSAGNCVSRDPETGIRNIGNHRCMVKSPTRLGLAAPMPKHIRQHWQKWKKKGMPMPLAIVVGTTPNIGLVAVTSISYGVDEYDVAGGIAGKPVDLVKCQTVDLEVPATAEIVIEGEVATDYLETEGPFGEFTGYMGMGGAGLVFNATCITHRKQPIWNSYISQFPPSESSLMTQVGLEAAHYKLLKHDIGVDPLVDVGFHEDTGGRILCVISLKGATIPQVWQAMYGAVAHNPDYSKIVIAVDDDIDPRDMDSVAWALCYRMQPHRDVQILQGKSTALDPSAAPPEQDNMIVRPLTSALLINATRRWAYPPTSLPKKEFMERARKIWEEEGLPALNPKVPWYGLSLGYWPEDDEIAAELAVKGEHYKTGEKLIKSRIKV